MIQTLGYDTGRKDEFLTLYRACLEHYKVSPATPEQEARILELLASGQHMSCLMAYDADVPVGFATWALTFPAGAGLALYMKELFVTRSARGSGAGRALLAGLVGIAETEHCTRFDWQTDRDNEMSQAFYRSIGSPTFEKLTYRVDAAGFAKFRASIS